jgi:hypothetical protein
MARTRGAAWLLLLLAATACTSSQDAEGASPVTSTPVQASTPPTRQAVLVTAPQLDEGLGEIRAGQRAATRGNASFDYVGGERGKALIVAVSCQGGGKITVEVPVVDVSFPLECPAGEPSVTYNQFAFKAAYKAGTVSVTAPSTVTWSVTVGRGDGAEEETG